MSSSVGGSDNNAGKEAEIRRMREQYKKREADLVKRHSKEVRNLTQANQSEVERIREQNEMRVKDMREKSRETMSRRDAKYQEQMERMRGHHTNQLDRLMKDNEVKIKTQRKASEGEVKQATLGKEGRVKELEQKYMGTLANNRENFERQIGDAREEQQKSLEKFKRYSNEQKEKQTDLTKDYYDRRLMEIKNDLRTTRQSAKERLTTQEVRHNRDKMRMNDNFMGEIERRDRNASENSSAQRENFQDSLSEIRQDARLANEKAREKASLQHQNLKTSVGDRVEEREKRLESKINDLQTDNTRKEIRYKQDAQQEVKRWQKAYNQKFEKLEQARLDTLNSANDANSDNVKVIRKEATDVIQANNRYMKNQMDTEVFKSTQALDQQEKEFKLRTDYHKENADTRIDRIREESFVNDARQREVYDRNVEELKRGHAEEVIQLRLNMNKEKVEQLAAMKAQIQKQEVEHTRKLEDVVQKYEKRIADLNDQFTREKRLSGNREKQLTEALSRASDQDKENLKIKYEEKFQQTLQQHNDEKRRMAISHKEQVDNIMSQVRKA